MNFKRVDWKLLKNVFLWLFLISIVWVRLLGTSPYLGHFYFLSSSFWQGHLDITEVLKAYLPLVENEILTTDFAIFGDKYFVYLGIFPALLGLPLVFLGQFGYELVMVVSFFALLVWALNLMVKHFLKKDSLFITLLLLFCSPVLTALVFPGPWYLAGLIVFSLGVWFCWLFLVKKKKWSVQLIAPLFLTRPTTIFYALIPLFSIFKNFGKEKKTLNYLLLTLFLCSLIAGGYNFLRFGHPLEFGYSYAFVLPDEYRFFRAQETLRDYFFSNALYLFVNPPWPITNQALRFVFPFFELSRFGVGLLFIAPWFLPYFFLNPRKKKDGSYWLAVSGMAAVILAFSGEGSFQIGSRYACDFFPILLFVFLNWLSENKKHQPLFRKLLVFSLFLNLYFYFLAASGYLRSN